MELSHLQVFFDVAKVGSFTAAAHRLNISQSALSRSVALLEEDKAVRLFDRSKKGVTLTKIGNEVFRHCEQLFETVNKIEDVCRGVQLNCEGPLAFATADHIINDLLIEPLQAFRREYVGVIPSLTIGNPDDVIASVLNQNCEFGLLFSKVAIPQIDYEPLREEPMVLVVHSDVWRENKASKQQVTLDRVLDRVGYISSIGAHKQSRPSRVLLELFGRMPRIGFEVSSQEAQKRVCKAKGGVAYLARFMVEAEIKSGMLHEIEVETPHAFKLWLATQKGRHLSVPSRVFLDRLRSQWNLPRKT